MAECALYRDKREVNFEIVRAPHIGGVTKVY